MKFIHEISSDQEYMRLARLGQLDDYFIRRRNAGVTGSNRRKTSRKGGGLT